MSHPRKYITLIHKSIGKVPNWEPSYPYELGDYGLWNKNTGLFDREGNIFKDKMTKNVKELEEVVEKHGGTDDFCTYSSFGTTDTGASFGPHIEIPSTAEAIFRTNIQFGRSFGAVLFMHRPQTAKLERVQQLLRSDSYDHLRGRALITQTVTCSAYFMYLSAQNKETLSVAFCIKLPVGAAVGFPVNAGGELRGEWIHQVTSGFAQRASDLKQKYTPLLVTMEIGRRKWGWRDGIVGPPGTEDQEEDCWLISNLPWEDDEEEEVIQKPEPEPVVEPPTPVANEEW